MNYMFQTLQIARSITALL